MRKLVVATGLAMLLPLASLAAADEAGGGAGALLIGPTVLSQGRTVVPVRMTRQLCAETGTRAELVIDGLAYDAPPGVMYEVSLQASNGRVAQVGLISFYNRTAPGYGAAGSPEDDDDRTFDVTEALRVLGGEATGLVFEPSSGVAARGISAAANPAARVRFASVRLK